MKYKYDISVLAVFKNEESFLPEWLDHYFNRNIDYLYLINDNSTDNSVDIILNHTNSKNINLVHTDESDKKYRRDMRQWYLYNKYYKHLIKKETKWIGIFDLDEFCYAPSDINLKYIIKQFDNKEYQELIIDWYWFGSNNFIEQPKKIIESFTKRSKLLSKDVSKAYHDRQEDDIIGYHFKWCSKSFSKTKHISKLKHHYNSFVYGGNPYYESLGNNKDFSVNLSEENIMFVNHYLGSYNHFMYNKVKRGSCNHNINIAKNKTKIYPLINLNEIEDLRLNNQNLYNI